MAAAREHNEPRRWRPCYARVVRRLLAHFDEVFDLDYRAGGDRLGDLVEGLLDAVQVEDMPEFGTEGETSERELKTSRFVRFYYRPHLFAGMDAELRLAHQLQFHLLPRAVPEGAPVSIAAVLESYCHLSGDVCAWETLNDGKFLMWIVDMAGHGVRSGLYSAVLKLLVDRTPERGRVGQFLADVSHALYDSLRSKHSALFATGFFLAVDADGSATYASAGHPPMLVRRRTGEIEELGSLSVPLGLFQEQQFGSEALRLHAGDSLLLYTDGLVETKSRDGGEFGLERIRNLFAMHFDAPEEMTGSIYREIATRQDLEKLEDDVTFLVARLG